MSYRELRNFCEIMRALGYPRLISLENFRKPNFELVADILYWLALRYEPNAEISEDIDEEKDRVNFIRSVTMLFYSKARIKLNPKKLYTADGYAVQELLKVATMLYNAYRVKGDEQEESRDFVLPTKLSNLKGTKSVAQEIIDMGAKLHDLLEKEGELKEHREKALDFLENISRNLNTNTEQEYIEKKVREIIQQQTENIKDMHTVVKNLEKDEKVLDENIRRQSQALEREEKRLKSMTNVKPAYMEEYERLEQELERFYSLYLEKFRNLDYLEHQMDLYHQREEEKFQEHQKALKKMQEKIKAEEWKMIRGEAEMDQDLLDQQILRDENLNTRAQSRGKGAGVGRMEGGGGRQKYGGDLNAPAEEDEDEDLGDDDEEGVGDNDNEGGDDDDDDFGDVQRGGGGGAESDDDF